MKNFSHPWIGNKQCFEFVILNEKNAKYTRNICLVEICEINEIPISVTWGTHFTLFC